MPGMQRRGPWVAVVSYNAAGPHSMHLASRAWAPRAIFPFAPRGVAAALALLRVDGAPSALSIGREKKKKRKKRRKKVIGLRVVHIIGDS